jgi:hypothetical protein
MGEGDANGRQQHQIEGKPGPKPSVNLTHTRGAASPRQPSILFAVFLAWQSFEL